MRQREVRKLMIDANLTAAEVGRRLGVSRSAIAHIIAGRRTSPRLQAGLAKLLGLPVEDIWGDGISETGECQRVDDNPDSQ